jgi:hypothetical protein
MAARGEAHDGRGYGDRQRNARTGCSSIAFGATPVWPSLKSKKATPVTRAMPQSWTCCRASAFDGDEAASRQRCRTAMVTRRSSSASRRQARGGSRRQLQVGRASPPPQASHVLPGSFEASPRPRTLASLFEQEAVSSMIRVARSARNAAWSSGVPPKAVGGDYLCRLQARPGRGRVERERAAPGAGVRLPLALTWGLLRPDLVAGLCESLVAGAVRVRAGRPFATPPRVPSTVL